MGFEYRNELLDMYRARLAAYGMDSDLIDQGREAVMQAVGNDYEAYAMLLEDANMSEVYVMHVVNVQRVIKTDE